MYLKIYIVMVFVMAAIFHVYWALGGKAGTKAAVPENEYGPLFKAESWGTFLVAVVFMAGSVLLLLDLSGYQIFFLQKYLIHLIAFVFFARAIGDFKYVGLFKKVKNTPFASYDTLFFTPLCLSVSISSVMILVI